MSKKYQTLYIIRLHFIILFISTCGRTKLIGLIKKKTTLSTCSQRNWTLNTNWYVLHRQSFYLLFPGPEFTIYSPLVFYKFTKALFLGLQVLCTAYLLKTKEEIRSDWKWAAKELFFYLQGSKRFVFFVVAVLERETPIRKLPLN